MSPPQLTVSDLRDAPRVTAQTQLVVIGNGMAGARVVEEILQRDPAQFGLFGQQEDD